MLFKNYRTLKWIVIFILTLILGVFLFGLWFKSLIPPLNKNLEATQANSLPYLSEDVIPFRGRILIVVTSTDRLGKSEKRTGYELSELARAYTVFVANGFEVDIASPKGGSPPVVIDDEDMGPFDYAFLNDSIAQEKSKNTLNIDTVQAADYQAIFFAGGKGAMFDFPNNLAIHSLVKSFHQTEKVIGAVCHGPAALVNVVLDNGQAIIKDKEISAFTNKEELLLIKNAKDIFPFLLEDKLTENGAIFNEGEMYLEQISHSDNIITGQNPWSTWKLAEEMVIQLGFQPKQRALSGEENAVKILSVYQKDGNKKARELTKTLLIKEKKPVRRTLIAKHSIMAAMKGEITDFLGLLRLFALAEKCESEQ